MVLTLERLAEEIVKEINAGMEIKAQKEIVLKNNYNRQIGVSVRRAGAFGANVILRSGIEGEIQKRLHTEKLLLLPSSIYEWIALPFPKENIIQKKT